MPKFHISVFGCQMSKSDAERLTAACQKMGYTPATTEKTADILLVNACSVRQSAIDRVFGLGEKWRQWKKTRPKLVTVLTGCVLPADRQKFKKFFDIILDIGEFYTLDKELKKHFKTGKLLSKEYFDYLKIFPEHNSTFSALVPIGTGCNNFCTYCAVPYARGRERNRSVKEIMGEVKDLAARGYKEIILLGQTVNRYLPPDKKSFSKNNHYKNHFAALLWELNKIKGIDRIFFTAPHPALMDDDIIKALCLPKLVNYLHLPLQAGDDEVLKRMNRNYTAKDYLTVVKKIRVVKPDIALGTDIIVGFPSETREQFQHTVDLYQKCDFDISYHARYSPRPGTVAAKNFPDNVSRAEKKRRWQVLQNLMEKTTLKKNQKYKNKIVSVLVHGWKRGIAFGNSREMKLVEFPGEKSLIGQVVKVKIAQPLTWVLRGKQV